VQSKNPGPVFDPALSLELGPKGAPFSPASVHPRGMKCAERRRKEVMPVFERPYLKKNSIPPRRGGKYFIHICANQNTTMDEKMKEIGINPDPPSKRIENLVVLDESSR
jgi:hypothetical protein